MKTGETQVRKKDEWGKVIKKENNMGRGKLKKE